MRGCREKKNDTLNFRWHEQKVSHLPHHSNSNSVYFIQASFKKVWLTGLAFGLLKWIVGREKKEMESWLPPPSISDSERALILCDSFCLSWKQQGCLCVCVCGGGVQKVDISALMPHRFVSGLAMNLSPLVERQFVQVFGGFFLNVFTMFVQPVQTVQREFGSGC